MTSVGGHGHGTRYGSYHRYGPSTTARPPAPGNGEAETAHPVAMERQRRQCFCLPFPGGSGNISAHYPDQSPFRKTKNEDMRRTPANGRCRIVSLVEGRDSPDSCRVSPGALTLPPPGIEVIPGERTGAGTCRVDPPVRPSGPSQWVARAGGVTACCPGQYPSPRDGPSTARRNRVGISSRRR